MAPTTRTHEIDRRTLLAAVASVGTGSLAGCSFTQSGPDAETTEIDTEFAETLATRFAPTLFFDASEPWFPTDPRPYTTERDGETVVDGFAALNDYHAAYAEREEPPNPTVFYNAVEYADSPLAVVQFWMYSVFDQFTANFHWHDWEVLHVFVDTDTGEPQLYVASSHSTRVPNNEFLDPNPDRVPRILSELGSHSSALSVNNNPDQFQRLPGADFVADITNTAIEGLKSISELPLAYGLPRDEGWLLPYVVPEYEGEPVYDHERLPDVDSESLIDDDLVIRSFEALSSPPTDLPERRNGVVFRHEGRTATGDETGGTETQTAYTYELAPTSEVEEIADLTGPQLSFEFPVPKFAEDAVASHITTAGVPWQQPRYENPAEDITDPNHRAALAERYDAIGSAAPINTVVTSVSEAISNDDAPDGEGLTTGEPTVEAVAFLESESTALPTFRGVAAARDVPAGEHRLTVNGAGQAPYSERVTVGADDAGDGTTAVSTDATGDSTDATATADSGDTATATDGVEAAASSAAERVTTAGVDAEIPLVARENAQKLEVDADGTDADLTDLAVEDDFAGRLYDLPMDGPEAVYIHRGGAYTTEVRDAAGEFGAFRVNPGVGAGSDDTDADGEGSNADAGPAIRIENPETGKASLSSFLVTIAEETRAQAAALLDGDLSGREHSVKGLVRALEAVVEAARRATENAREGNRGNANQQLQAVETRLQRVVERVDAASDDLPDPFENAVRNRVDQADKRTEQALNAERL